MTENDNELFEAGNYSAMIDYSEIFAGMADTEAVQWLRKRMETRNDQPMRNVTPARLRITNGENG